MLKALTLTFLFLLTQGCKLAVYTPPLIRQCMYHCQYELKACQNTCLTDCNHCCQYTKAQAKSFHQRYLARARIEGKPAFSSLHSFYDPLQCNKNSCNCQIDFLLCKQKCQGNIHKRLKIYKYC